MSRINIEEKDYTTPVASYQTTDVVFVPGFSTLSLSADGAVQPWIPTLCKNLAEFNSYFGNTTPTFATNQPYMSSIDQSGTFSSAALTGLSGVWFSAGAADPSYIYAKELLAQGISVVYERMNVSNSDITVDAAYSYMHNQVFSASRPASIPYPTATTFSSSSTYNVGDLVTYESNSVTNTYECIVAITVAGAFDPANWKMLDADQDTAQPLLDLGLGVKYITSGGYPTHEFTIKGGSGTLAGAMQTLATTRGDCIALIDYLDNENRKPSPISDTNSLIGSVQSLSSDYAAMFAPWIEVSFTQSYDGTSNNHMPGSFAYLTALAQDLTFTSNTAAVAGINKGQVPNLKAIPTIYPVTNTIAEEAFQPETGVSINGITKINPYGYRIWGNRTMKSNASGTTATSFLNIRNVVSDVKKAVYTAAMNVLFEPNVQITWISFTSKITPVLDALISNYGLSRYQIERNTVNPDGSKLANTVMSATVTLYPVYSIEKITVTIAIRDDDTVEVA